MHKQIQFEITNKCNLKCEFCYNWALINSSKKDEISKQDILKKAGLRNIIYLGGGEPTLFSSGIEELARCLTCNQNKVILSTNAVIFKDFNAEKNFSLQINLPAGGRELYREITGKDVFDVVRENIRKYIRKLKNNVFIKMPVYQKNLGDIDLVYRFCREIKIPLVISPVFEGSRVRGADPRYLRDKVFDLTANCKGEIYCSRSKNPSEISDLEYQGC